MTKPESFIVLEGYLYENMEFEFLRGYEVRYARQQDRVIRQDSLITAKLLNDEGQTLIVVTPEVSFPTGCSAAPSAPGFGLLHIVLPLHPATRLIELHTYYDRIIFSAPVSKIRPSALTLHLEPRTEERTIQFKIDSPADTGHIEFFLIDATGRRFSTTPVTSGDVYSIDLQRYVGHEFLRLCASVSRDFRTSETFSQSFKLPLGKIQGRILEPKNQSEWSAGSSISLTGNLFYDNGKAASWDPATISWIIDDHAINDRRQIAVQEEFPPGEHSIELRYQPLQGNPVVLDRVSIRVLDETEAQKKYVVIMAKYLATTKEELEEL